MSRGTPGVASRTRWFVFALLPLLVLRALETPTGFAFVLGMSLLLALVLSAAAVSLQGQSPRLAWLDEATWSSGLLLPLWFGAGLSPGWMVAAQCVALASRLSFGGMGLQVFHPAMAAIAVVLLFGQAPVQPPMALVATGLAAAVAAALLAWRLRRDLRAPLALVIAFAGAQVLVRVPGHAPLPGAVDWLCLCLAAAVVANDPVTTPTRPAARVVFGTSAGLAAALLPDGASALPFALLALQAVAPWLERSAGWRTPRALPGAPGDAA